jgi:hypothetical protein
MTDEECQLLRGIIDHCNKQWQAACQGKAWPGDTPTVAARRKAAYATVARIAGELLAEDTDAGGASVL